MWIIREWKHILPEVNVKGFNFYCTSNSIEENDDDDEAVMRMGIFGVSVRKMMAMTVKTVKKIGKGR
jgi:hypothetical protein